MSKAEELSEKAYPEGDTYIFGDASIACQVAYVKGYHQAEKDLELTWEDVRRIYLIVNSTINDVGMDNLTDKSIYQEVLKRFNKERR